MKPLSECRLYAFVDSAYLDGRSPTLIAQQLCDGGADLIQLRAKQLPANEIRLWAEQILPVTTKANVGLVINDHLEIAAEVGAPWCHLGQEDFFDAGYTQVSELFARPVMKGAGLEDAAQDCVPAQENLHASPRPEVRVGLSTHAPEQALRAVAAGAQYVAIGPVFATGTKPTAKPVTLEYVRWAAASIDLPWFAIGGINLSNLDQVLSAGARRICVVSAILNAPDVQKACREFRERLPD